MNRRVFKLAELRELIDGAEEVGSRDWRHGRHITFVFEHEGTHWRVELPCHHEEGLQFDFNEYTLPEVHQVEKTVKSWEITP